MFCQCTCACVVCIWFTVQSGLLKKDYIVHVWKKRLLIYSILQNFVHEVNFFISISQSNFTKIFD